MSDLQIWLSLISVAMITVMVMIYTSFGLMFLFGAPWVPTSKKVARRMLKFANLKKGETIIDVGSGDGSILIVALRDFGASKAIGYELNPFLNKLARLRAKIAGVSHRLELRTVNVHKEPFEEADVLSMYLLHEMLDKLRPKLARELTNKTRIVSRGFEFTDVKVSKQDRVGRDLFTMYEPENL